MTASPHVASARAASADAATEASPADPVLPASLRRRLAALTYECLLLSAVVLFAGFLLAPFLSPPQSPAIGRSLQVPGLPERVLSFALLFAVGALYFAWSWTGGRRTLPLKTWRMRLIRRDGAVLDAKTALVRYFAAWIGPGAAVIAYAAMAPSLPARLGLCLIGLNFAWALVDPQRLFLHDRIAGTRIVSDLPPPPSSRLPR